MKQYRIHPGIGLARIGNSEAAEEEGYFIGPEVPDMAFTPPPNGSYRDSNEKVRRQGARFRIYEYTYEKQDSTDPTSVREITNAEAEIQWHVNLANLKSFSRDPNGGDRVAHPNRPGMKSIAYGRPVSSPLGAASSRIRSIRC